jgi:Methyltransferase domain
VDAPQEERITIPADNRPAPLRCSVPFFADADCQMSFGERAALEGLLVALSPRLAVEVGTYEGGSLRFLAAHCRHVHTIDLYDLVPDPARFTNVTFHHGDSRLLLPELLGRLAREGRAIDLVLIDGDHSAEGVSRDLACVLDSPAAAATVILLHDTMNPEVRLGIERVGLAGRANVVYYELDLVAGYEFAGGHFDGQVWGGLGIVVTGDRGASGYGDSPAQNRYREPYRLRTDIGELRAQLDAARSELEFSRHGLQVIQSSRSWRMTAPLRAAKRRLTAAGVRFR